MSIKACRVHCHGTGSTFFFIAKHKPSSLSLALFRDFEDINFIYGICKRLLLNTLGVRRDYISPSMFSS